MIPLKLKLKNFYSYRDVELDFTKLGDICLIVGEIENKRKSNGAGKTTLFEAITFALFGQCRATGSKNVSIDNVVTYGEKEATVDFSFLIDKEQYSVTRIRNNSRKTTKSHFSVWTGTRWKALGGSKKDTNKKIIEKIGIDYTVFLNSVYFKQNEVSAFAEMTSGERKDVVKKLIQINKYEGYTSAARKKYDDLIQQTEVEQTFLDENENVELELEGTKKEIKNATTKVDLYQKDVDICKNKVKGLREDIAKIREKVFAKTSLTTEVANLLKDITAYDDEEKEIGNNKKTYEEDKKSATQKHDELVNEFNELVKKTPSANELKKRMAEMKDKYAKVEVKRDDALAEKSEYNSKVKTVKSSIEKINKLGVGKCPTCFIDVTEKSKEEVEVHLKLEYGKLQPKDEEADKAYEKQVEALAALDKKIVEIRSEAELYNRSIQEKKLINEKIQNQITFGTTAQLNLEKADEAFEKLKKERIEKKASLAIKQKELKGLEKVNVEKGDELQGQISTEESKIENTNQLINDVSTQKGTLLEQKNNLEETQKEVDRITNKFKHVQKQKQIYKELIKIFGKDGIQAAILENCAVEIEQIANNLLEDFTDGAMSISIETLRKNKNDDNYQEVFDIIIRDNSRIGAFEMFSGGEKFKVAFAIRIALSMLLSKRSGVQIPFVLYDEAFSDLDADGTDRLVNIFTVLKKYFSLQLVITHDSQLKEKFGSLITVKKNAKGSQLVY